MREALAQLRLGDPGWAKIEGAVFRVNGDLDAIVREMAAVLRDDTVHALCVKLGILCSGFLFIDPIKKGTRFFTNTPRQETYRTEYIWSNKEAGSRWNDTVHQLFVQMRLAQGKQVLPDEKRTEDFFRHIPKDDSCQCCIAKADQDVRREHGFHYVSLGEMLFTMIAWRCVAAADKRGWGDVALDNLNVPFEDPCEELSCSWNGLDLLDLSVGENPSRNELEKLGVAWSHVCTRTNSLATFWAGLGLRDSSGGESIAFRALKRFSKTIGAVSDKDDAELSCEFLNAAIQRFVSPFLNLLGVSPLPTTIRAAKIALERYARFPIFPFLMWYVLDDGAPKCYLVSPIWTSQQFVIEVDDRDFKTCRHLGIALSAVSPLRSVDWTLPTDVSAAEGQLCSSADPFVVANVIRLMGRPLVEENLYSSVLREIEERGIAATRETVKRVIQAISEGGGGLPAA